MNPPLIGVTLANKYEIQAEIGRGGMGIVYRGYDVMLRRSVAVKVLPLEYTYDRQFVDRFRQEAITAAGLHHSAIVTIHDVGQQGPWHYIVMQYLDGQTLEQWLLNHGSMALPMTAQVVRQVADALDYAHHAGIVHRDIKPSNIMFGPDGHVTLMDFGLVRAVEGSQLTRSGVVVGTPEYMAPEQALGDAVDGRTDIYSLGVVVYRLLTGRIPFVRSTPMASAYAHAHDPPLPPRVLRPDLPRSIEAVVLKTLAKRPTERYQSGAQLAADFDLAASGKVPPGLKGINTPPTIRSAAPPPAQHPALLTRRVVGEHAVSPADGQTMPMPAHPGANEAARTTPAHSGTHSLSPLGLGAATPGTSPLTQKLPFWRIMAVLVGIILLAVAGLALTHQQTAATLATPTVAAPTVHVQAAETQMPTSAPTAMPTLALATSQPPIFRLANQAKITFDWQPSASQREDFSQINPGWYVGDNDSGLWQVSDGAYRLTIHTANSMVWLWRNISVGNFHVSVDVEPDQRFKDTRTGLLFRGSGAQDFYQLDYAPGKGYELSKRINGATTTLIRRTAVPRRGSVVRMGVTVLGPEIQVEIDGQAMARVVDTARGRGDVAIYGVSSNAADARFVFDNYAFEPAASEAIPMSLVPYLDPSSRFSLYVAENWTQSLDGSGVNFDWVEQLARVFVQQVSDAQADDTPEEVARKYILRARTTFENIVEREGQARTLGDRPAYERVISAQVMGANLVIHLVAVNDRGRGYVVVSAAEASHEPPLRPLLAYVIDSFRLDDSPMSSPTATMTPTSVPTAQVTATPTRVSVSKRPAPTSVLATATPTRQPVSMPGGRIAYSVWNGQTARFDTYVYRLSDGARTPYLPNLRQPDFNSKGELVANAEGASGDNLVRTDRDGNNLRIISAYTEDSRPHWSPSGISIVFDSTSQGDSRYRIYLQDDAGYRHSVPPLKINGQDLFGRYSVYLKNWRIAFNGCNNWSDGSVCGIYTIDGRGRNPLAATNQPSDIPTDNHESQIVFMSDRNGNWDVYLVNFDGANLQRLTSHPARDGLGTVSPDGSYVAFISDRDGAWAVYVVPISGGQEHKLFDLGGGYHTGEWDWLQERISWGP
ncbi:protein kinase domain-containing protein [Candidatus Amarolinea aalborgensis]|uniref:protein kinase domain-containing protein n=1 Tax=Candidatus Amarolinea aalborgensis TaxID=2249329 RepID=UPI003BF9E534